MRMTLTPAPHPAAHHIRSWGNSPIGGSNVGLLPKRCRHSPSPPRAAECQPAGTRIGALWPRQSYCSGPPLSLCRTGASGIEEYCGNAQERVVSQRNRHLVGPRLGVGVSPGEAVLLSTPPTRAPHLE